MVNLGRRLLDIKRLVDSGKYFTINRARQYGKTTTLRSLNRFLQAEYYVVLIDFQTFGNAKFKNENTFSLAFAHSFLRALKRNSLSNQDTFQEAIIRLEGYVNDRQKHFELKELFEELDNICDVSNFPVVLLIDEVDSATNYQVFIDFLAQLRACYIYRDIQATFQSVILAGVYDIKNLKGRINSDDSSKSGSPWNIAADFNIDMSFSADDIAGMLQEYENDNITGMDISKMAGLLYEYTSGYPFLVSRLCKLMDEEVSKNTLFQSKSKSWTENGFLEAVRMLLTEKNTLFDSLIGKLKVYPELNNMLNSLLFTGRSITYNTDESAIDMATMFGFIKNQQGSVAIANRIFETRLYNIFLAEHSRRSTSMPPAAEKNQFIHNGHLDMELVIQKFADFYREIFDGRKVQFLEDYGRCLFLLYIKPIINGTGNYYIEARTRTNRRTDVIIDYNGRQYIIELKIWHGQEYQKRGEKQLAEYLDSYQSKCGYLISFNFNQNKKTGIRRILIDGKSIMEAIV